MAGNVTLTMIKPDTLRDGHTGAILDMIIKGGFGIKALNRLIKKVEVFVILIN